MHKSLTKNDVFFTELGAIRGGCFWGSRSDFSSYFFISGPRKPIFFYCRANVCNFKILKSRKNLAIFGPVAAILDF